MTESVQNLQGQQIGIIEYLPNGLVYGFDYGTKMSFATKKKDDVLKELFPRQQVIVAR